MVKTFVDRLRRAAQVFTATGAPTHAAAIAFFTIFSLAPLVAFAVAIAGLFVGRAVAASEVTAVIGAELGPDVASYVTDLAAAAANRSSNATFTIIAIGTLLVGATAVFGQLKTSLDAIWGISYDHATLTSGLISTVRRRALSFLMVFVGGMVLVISVLLDVVVIQLETLLELWWPGISAWQPYQSWLLTPIIGFLVFAIMFKLLPDTRPSWPQVLAGAALTTILFTIGTVVISIYVQNSRVITLYGAASSLIVVLLWVYYCSWIVLFGASFTRVYGEPDGNHDA